jgi:hypothetical protein
MYSWSFKWLWAECLVASAGLFLLAHMALPAEKDLSMVKGVVNHVELTSRRKLGGFYDLTVKTPEGGEDRILIGRSVAPEPSIRALVGHNIAAGVNWSDVAVQFESADDSDGIAENVWKSAAERSRNYSIGGMIALALGLFLGLAGLILRLR